MIAMVSNLAMLVMGIMLFLGLIVINQLIDNSIKEKTYENAMLRTLGWNQSHIVFVTLMKAAIFQMLPGCVIGLYLAKILNDLMRTVIKDAGQAEVVLDYPW